VVSFYSTTLLNRVTTDQGNREFDSRGQNYGILFLSWENRDLGRGYGNFLCDYSLKMNDFQFCSTATGFDQLSIIQNFMHKTLKWN